MIQATRPQTLGYGLTDSPTGRLAWIGEKFREWTDPTAELPEHAVDRDALLTNVSLYWLTATATSSANLYYEGAANWGQAHQPSTVPTGVALFPHDTTIRQLAEREHNIVHWSEFDRGGHFAAMEWSPRKTCLLNRVKAETKRNILHVAEVLDRVIHRRKSSGPTLPISSHDAAKESNLPSGGLPRPAGFEVHPSEADSPCLWGIRSG
jgi:hypothetical protein